MRILFCRTTWMERYIGRENERYEMLYTGGAYMNEENIGGEEWNFLDVDGYCYGFVDTKFNKNGDKNKLHIERIDNSFKNSQNANNVLVIWVSKDKSEGLKIVGWYKNAKVYREYQNMPSREYNYEYNIKAKAEECILLPLEKRTFEVPTANKMEGNIKFGFGQANIWYANEENAKEFIEDVMKYIESYNGEKINIVYTDEMIEEKTEIDLNKTEEVLDEIEEILEQKNKEIEEGINENDNEDIRTIYDVYLDCVKKCNYILKTNENNSRAYLLKLYCLYGLNRFQKIIDEYTNNINKFDDSITKFEATHILIDAYYKKGKIDDVIRLFKLSL